MRTAVAMLSATVLLACFACWMLYVVSSDTYQPW